MVKIGDEGQAMRDKRWNRLERRLEGDRLRLWLEGLTWLWLEELTRLRLERMRLARLG